MDQVPDIVLKHVHRHRRPFFICRRVRLYSQTTAFCHFSHLQACAELATSCMSPSVLSCDVNKLILFTRTCHEKSIGTLLHKKTISITHSPVYNRQMFQLKSQMTFSVQKRSIVHHKQQVGHADSKMSTSVSLRHAIFFQCMVV